MSLTASVLTMTALSGCCSPEPALTLVHMTDSQMGFWDYEKEALRYEQALRQINADAENANPEFMIMTGDMVNIPRADTNKDFLIRSEILEIPYYLVPGNHDYNNSPSTQARYAADFGADYYWFDSADGNYRIIVLNTNLWKNPGAKTAEFDAWVAETFEQAKADGKIIIAAGHCPIFLKSVDEPDDQYYNLPVERRKQVLQMFKDYGVVAYLGGHSHTRIDNTWEDIRFLHAENTCTNFDNRPFGYRIVFVNNRRVSDQFVKVE